MASSGGSSETTDEPCPADCDGATVSVSLRTLDWPEYDMLSPGSLRIPLVEDDLKGAIEPTFDSLTKLSRSGTSRRLERRYHNQKKRMNKINAKEPMMAPRYFSVTDEETIKRDKLTDNRADRNGW